MAKKVFQKDKLTSIRRERGFTMRELHEVSKVSLSTIRDIERGIIVNPRKETTDKLCKVFGVQRKYFYTDDKATALQPYYEIAEKFAQAEIPIGLLEAFLQTWIEKRR